MTAHSPLACMTLLVAAICAGLPGTAAAQPPAPPPATTSPAPAQTAPAPAAQPATPAPAYSYEAEGRRDPFVSLLGRGSDPRAIANRPPGVPGLLIDELSVKGVIKDRAGYVAMIQGPDNKTYMVRPGDKLMDGSVKSITGDSVVFSQDVNDPLSTVKQREKIKKLRSNEEGRE
jgi:Tfp pilus assembly protein PilP